VPAQLIEEGLHGGVEGVGPFHVGEVAGAGDDLELRGGDAFGQGAGGVRRRQHVLVAD
jgi:hypothetical protein